MPIDGVELDAMSGGATVAVDTVAGKSYQLVQIVTGAIDSAKSVANLDTDNVTITACALPSGAATLAEQETQTGHLASIVTSLSAGVQITDVLGAVAVYADAAFPVTDNGGSLTVDGTVAVSSVGGTVAVSGPITDTELRASAVPVSLASVPTHAVTDGGGSLTVDGTVAATQSGTWTVTGAGGTFPITDGGGSITVDGTVGVSGSVAVTGTFWQATQPVSAASLPLPSGAATAAKQPALGSAGTASADVLTVQGIASMTALKVDGSAVTQPVSLASVPSHAVTNAGTFAVQAAQSGTWTVQPGNTANTTAWLVTGTGGTFPATQSGTWSVRAQDGSGNSLTSATRGSERALSVQIVDGSGTQVTTFGGGTEYTEDAAAASDPVGRAVILVRKDTPATIVSADGDNVAQRGTNYGAAYVQLVTSAGAFIDSVGGGTQYTEGDTDATITGTAILWEDASDTLRAVSKTNALPVNVCPPTTIATGQVTVGTTATLIVAARSGRKRVTVVSHSSATDLWLGVSGVTTGSGFKWGTTGGTPFTLETDAAVYGIKGAGSQAVSYVEEY